MVARYSRAQHTRYNTDIPMCTRRFCNFLSTPFLYSPYVSRRRKYIFVFQLYDIDNIVYEYILCIIFSRSFALGFTYLFILLINVCIINIKLNYYPYGFSVCKQYTFIIDTNINMRILISVSLLIYVNY